MTQPKIFSMCIYIENNVKYVLYPVPYNPSSVTDFGITFMILKFRVHVHWK